MAKTVDVNEEIIGLLDKFRGHKGRVQKEEVVAALRTQAELLNRDTSWPVNTEGLDYDPDDLDDPQANPMGLQPAPKEATRADEATAPEPDSMGNIIDRKAAEAQLEDPELEKDAPPPDVDAMKAKKGMEKSEAQFGVRGETYDPTHVQRDVPDDKKRDTKKK